MKQEIKIDVLEEILSDIGLHLSPQLLKEEQRKIIDFSKINLSTLKKYYSLINNVNYSWFKITRYKLYFSEFYSNSPKMERFEELNHHIHAFFQDVDTLKNKMENLFNHLKKDLKEIAINEKDVVDFFNAGRSKLDEAFEGVLKYRRQHVHAGSRFIDEDLFKAEISSKVISTFSSPIFDKIINRSTWGEYVEKTEKIKNESFNAGQQRWIKNAENVETQITGLLESMLKIIRSNLYQFLGVKVIKDLVPENH